MAFTTVQSDGCTDTNGTLLLGHGADNALGGSGVFAWREVFGTGLTIQSNRATSPVTAATYVNYLNTTSTDGRVTANVYGVANGVGVVCRYNSGTVKFYAYIGGATNSRLFYFDSSTFNVIQDFGPALTDGDKMAIVCDGTTVYGYLNDVLVLTALNQLDIASGAPGTYLGGGSSQFDNFIYETGTAPVVTATHLAIGTAPVGNQSGVAFPTQPVVNVLDGSNAVVTTDTSTVSVALITVSGSGTLSGTTTKAAVSGVADFSGLGLKVTGAGSFKLRFTDGSLTLVDSATFYVGAAELAFTGTLPTDAYTQYVLTPSLTVAVQDGGGTTVGNSTASVTLALTSVSLTSEVELGTFTKSAVAGVATFDDLTFLGEEGASLRLTASSGSLAQASMTFTLHLRSLRVTFTGT